MQNSADRSWVLERYCIDRLAKTNDYRKRFLLWNELKNALNDPRHNFYQYIEYNPEEYASLAYTEEELGDARLLFKQFFSIATKKWHLELQQASREDPELW